MRSLLVVCMLAVMSSPAAAEDRAAARQAYIEASKYYDLNQYAEALEAFKRAYWNYEDPVILFNIAQCHRALNQKKEAIEAYRSYLRKAPDAKNRDDVQRIIGELDAAMTRERAVSVLPPQGTLETQPPETKPPTETKSPTETKPPAETKTPPAPVDTRSARVKKFAGIGVGAVGLAALAGGIACGVLAQKAGDDLTRLTREGKPYDAAKDRAGHNYTIAEGVLLGVGAAAVVVGAALLAVGVRQERAARVTWMPSIAPGQAALVLSGSLP